MKQHNLRVRLGIRQTQNKEAIARSFSYSARKPDPEKSTLDALLESTNYKVENATLVLKKRSKRAYT